MVSKGMMMTLTPVARRLKASGGLSTEWFRYLADRLMLLPAADLLPRSWALALADAVAFLDAALTSKGRAARKEMAVCAGLRGWPLFLAGARRVAVPSRDLVLLRRLRKGREDPRQWEVIEVNPKPVRALLAAGRPFLVVSGHFAHAPRMAVLTAVPALATDMVHSAVPAWTLSPHVLRERLQNRQEYGLMQLLIRRDEAERLPRVGEGNVVTALLKTLARPGAVALIMIDAWWERPGAYRRPFAGLADRGFALGAAAVARHAGCPLVPFLAVWNRNGAVQVEWGDPIEPAAADNALADVQIMDRLLDDLEGAVARYPVQYLLPIGWERRWNAARHAWTLAELNVPLQRGNAENALTGNEQELHRR